MKDLGCQGVPGIPSDTRFPNSFEPTAPLLHVKVDFGPGDQLVLGWEVRGSPEIMFLCG